MANRYGDPRVREWMKEHVEEIAAVQRRYDELKMWSTERLLQMAPAGVVAKVRDKLIVGIVAKGEQK